jgi:hypothetical protein
MKTVVSDLTVTDKNEFVDFDDADLVDCNVLFVAAREGQAIRAIKRNKVSVCGWWNLQQMGYLAVDGRIVPQAFKRFDKVIFANPRRVHEPVREIYTKLIAAVSSL